MDVADHFYCKYYLTLHKQYHNKLFLHKKKTMPSVDASFQMTTCDHLSTILPLGTVSY